MKKLNRCYIKDIKKGQLFLEGWAHDLRDLAKIKFILLRDISGVVQCIIKDKKLFKKFSEITLESVISIKGKAKAAQVKSPEVTKKDIEIEIINFEIINKAEQLPILVKEKDKSITTDISKRLDNRSIDLRKPEVKAIFKIQSEITRSFREFFSSRNFIEIQTPCIISSASEGGTELFPVKYFERDAFLAQSPQLYKQLVAIALEKVTCIVPVWRAEKHNTTRHLNESRQMDIEVAFVDDMEVLKYLENVIQYVVKNVIENCKEELKILNKKITIPKVKYLSYDETIKILKKIHMKCQDGEEFESVHEKKLCSLFPDTLIIIHSYPSKAKPFYIWPKDQKKGISGGFDALLGGIEISSGGQRVHDPEILIKQLRERGLNPDNFKHYIDAFRYGAPFHSGWSIGLERFTMALLNLENIREACLFPRDRDRLTP
jgi:aspartyl-tRNA synthetase